MNLFPLTSYFFSKSPNNWELNTHSWLIHLEKHERRSNVQFVSRSFVSPGAIILVISCPLYFWFTGKHCVAPVSGVKLHWAANGSSSTYWQTDWILPLVLGGSHADRSEVWKTHQQKNKPLEPRSKFKNDVGWRKERKWKFAVDTHTHTHTHTTHTHAHTVSITPAWCGHRHNQGKTISSSLVLCDGKCFNPWRKVVTQWKQPSWATITASWSWGMQELVNIIIQ